MNELCYKALFLNTWPWFGFKVFELILLKNGSKDFFPVFMSAFSGGWGIIINHKSHSTLSLNYTEGSRNSAIWIYLHTWIPETTMDSQFVSLFAAIIAVTSCLSFVKVSLKDQLTWVLPQCIDFVIANVSRDYPSTIHSREAVAFVMLLATNMDKCARPKDGTVEMSLEIRLNQRTAR